MIATIMPCVLRMVWSFLTLMLIRMAPIRAPVLVVRSVVDISGAIVRLAVMAPVVVIIAAIPVHRAVINRTSMMVVAHDQAVMRPVIAVAVIGRTAVDDHVDDVDQHTAQAILGVHRGTQHTQSKPKRKQQRDQPTRCEHGSQLQEASHAAKRESTLQL